MYIDPHVHCRDWEESHKETIEHALKVAESVDVCAIFDMPNTKPAITTRDLVERRLDSANSVESDVFYGLYMGLTSDPEQVKEAIETYRDFRQIVGLKLFAGHSVGDLAVVEEDKQKLVYGVLSREGFDGVLVVHCEKENYMSPGIWNPEKPKSHNIARPKVAEIESVKDQIKFAFESDFRGYLHIPHISTHTSVDLVNEARRRLKIGCGATPHHSLIYSSDLLYKVNPPLRSKSDADEILSDLRAGRIDWLETDHAPHTLEEKTQEPYMSGLPGLPFYGVFVEELRKQSFTEDRIRQITFDRINEVFGLDLEPKEFDVSKDFSGDYCFNPYEVLNA